MTLKKELPLIAIVLTPFLYLAYIWNNLPAEVPIHWNGSGEIDGWGNKSTLLMIPVLLPLLSYIIFSIVPKIDPKKKIEANSKKFYTIKFLLTLFMSILALFILYSSKNKSFTNPNIIILLIGILYIVLGNYMKTFRPNYFIGIRTPWTLESESVWKKTHQMAGKYWFIGGLIIVCSCLVLDKKTSATLFLIVTTIITVIPIAYSYLEFKKLEKQNTTL